MPTPSPLPLGAAILPFRRDEAAATPLLLSPPLLTGEEETQFARLLQSGWLAPAGPTLAAFEAAVGEAAGFPHVLATGSATAALLLAYRLLGVGPGDEVWTSSLTFIATIAPAVQMGATPRFLDVSPESWTLDPALLAEELAAAAQRGRLPRVVVSVDLYGQPADIPALRAACDRWGVPLVSDSACALGATQHGRPAGQGACLAVTSFNGNKIVTAGGGGALLADEAAPIARARHLATQARDPAPHYEHTEAGFNLVMSAVLAAVGLAQLPALERRVLARRRLFDRYAAALGALPGLSFMPEPGWARSTRWLSAMLVEPRRFGADREALRRALLAEGIESRPVWKPLHLQPAFHHAPFAGGAVAAALFERGLCLPSGSGMGAAEQDRVIAAVAGLARA
ncbi:DegT/DnrJ/EryC1/StrS family aminotransferase [Sabulicella glaciei]|uniref:DegT/DnrJ/EryC1/StrS family aminotransferase n=1 Tax=Sabulicella glaciei TaxID=2984948 RepID=A0ABT3NVS8_9PROT|nr:DegT/DnrJ/EryC1/StrS family aminotransferase [Roseococcus sp. MDT2-1-1]MCW8085988.1 DegT/DnrJ/EryC1/StrS family aminotransferase [Roseococcus sp. MDT2-1-1]